jgi:hypothetical protein
MAKKRSRKAGSFFAEHSLSIVVVAVVVLLLAAYSKSDSETHWGAFFGNAIADWTGLAVFVIITKYFYEIGSTESRQPKSRPKNWLHRLWQDHSLTIVLLITGLGWVVLNARMRPASHWGQVIGNIVSEWTQLLGIVLLTKNLFERGSKESSD